jgi:hypothetical protein
MSNTTETNTVNSAATTPTVKAPKIEVVVPAATKELLLFAGSKDVLASYRRIGKAAGITNGAELTPELFVAHAHAAVDWSKTLVKKVADKYAIALPEGFITPRKPRAAKPKAETTPAATTPTTEEAPAAQ